MWKHSVELWSLASCRLLHRSHPVHLPIGQPGHKHVMWHNTYWRNVIMVCSIRDAHILNTLDLGDWGETSISQAKYNKNKSGILQNMIKFAIWPLSPVSESQKLLPFDALARESCSPDLNKCHIVMISVVISVKVKSAMHKKIISTNSESRRNRKYSTVRSELPLGYHSVMEGFRLCGRK